jgi:hypothetical protein
VAHQKAHELEKRGVIISFDVPIRIASANRTRDRHWGVRKRATDAQRKAVAMVWLARGGNRLHPLTFAATRLLVTFTRIAPRPIADTDNLISGWKAVQDEVARLLGINDGDARIGFAYKQERGRPKEYAARIRIESR